MVKKEKKSKIIKTINFRKKSNKDKQYRLNDKKKKKNPIKKILRTFSLISFLISLYLGLNIYAITQLELHSDFESVLENLFNFEIDPTNPEKPLDLKPEHEIKLKLENTKRIPITIIPISIQINQQDVNIINANSDFFFLGPMKTKNLTIDLYVNYADFVPKLINSQLKNEEIDGMVDIEIFIFNKKVYTLKQNLFGTSEQKNEEFIYEKV